MKEFLERELFKMNRGLVATPNSREDLEAFAKANGGSMDIVLMQMAINYGYKIALENVQEELEKEVVQMAERDIKGTWKIKEQKVARTFSPMIGAVYEGQDKFFGGTVVGILVEMFDQNDEAILKTKENKLTSVDKNSLKIVA